MVFTSERQAECKKLREYESRGRTKRVAMFQALDDKGQDDGSRWFECFVPDSLNGSTPVVGQKGTVRVRATVYSAARQRADESLFTVDQTGFVLHEFVTA